LESLATSCLPRVWGGEPLGVSRQRESERERRSEAHLGPPLQEAHEGDDLRLGGERKRIPLLRRREARGVRRSLAAALEREREVDAVGLHAESNERSHRDARVLNLRLTEEAVGGLVTLGPEVGRGETQRVVCGQGGWRAGEGVRRPSAGHLCKAAPDV